MCQRPKSLVSPSRSTRLSGCTAITHGQPRHVACPHRQTESTRQTDRHGFFLHFQTETSLPPARPFPHLLSSQSFCSTAVLHAAVLFFLSFFLSFFLFFFGSFLFFWWLFCFCLTAAYFACRVCVCVHVCFVARALLATCWSFQHLAACTWYWHVFVALFLPPPHPQVFCFAGVFVVCVMVLLRCVCVCISLWSLVCSCSKFFSTKQPLFPSYYLLIVCLSLSVLCVVARLCLGVSCVRMHACVCV